MQTQLGSKIILIEGLSIEAEQVFTMQTPE